MAEVERRRYTVKQKNQRFNCLPKTYIGCVMLQAPFNDSQYEFNIVDNTYEVGIVIIIILQTVVVWRRKIR